MMTSNEPRAVVAGHGTFALGIISAVDQIAGRGASLTPVSNTGLSPAELEEALRAAVAFTGATVIFTDLPAGSCTIAARRLNRTLPELTIVVGVGLPTLLGFVLGSSLEEAVSKGRDAQRIVEPPRVD